jgi:hypothetical protein
MASGGFLVISHGACADQQLLQYGRHLYGHSSTPRTREDIRAFMAGTQIIEPGVVWTPQWRPEFEPGAHPEQARIYAAVGCKP